MVPVDSGGRLTISEGTTLEKSSSLTTTLARLIGSVSMAAIRGPLYVPSPPPANLFTMTCNSPAIYQPPCPRLFSVEDLPFEIPLTCRIMSGLPDLSNKEPSTGKYSLDPTVFPIATHPSQKRFWRNPDPPARASKARFRTSIQSLHPARGLTGISCRTSWHGIRHGRKRCR